MSTKSTLTKNTIKTKKYMEKRLLKTNKLKEIFKSQKDLQITKHQVKGHLRKVEIRATQILRSMLSN
jgi:hypothetical protein